ncbi:hypothetical protein AB6A40_002191 [Gnathostoma spinigerum]|uniref:Protein-tyrosine phosphatase n=1 Tax=Gnathostoma spinigerum TaxID=75299 RepID=A0ABD6EFM9_9BILA
MKFSDVFHLIDLCECHFVLLSFFLCQVSALAKIITRIRDVLMTASGADSSSNVQSGSQLMTPAESMSRFIRHTSSKGLSGLAEEYHKIDREDSICGAYKAFANNMSKNRYSDVYCIDDTRVVLMLGSNGEGDYIHANVVSFPELQNKFICTQGPLQSTLNDFWRMIFQERAETILMLCRPAEEGKPKCCIYWPEPNQKLELKTVTVEHIGSESTEFDTIKLKVDLKENLTGTTNGTNSESLIVRQHRWSTWPDRGIPDHESSLVPLKLLSYVRQSKAPCVVHCSAGIGRTGTVIAIEMGIKRFEMGQKVDAATLVKDLRRKRAQCIQTEVQYLYLCRVLVEYALQSSEKLPNDIRNKAAAFLKEYDMKCKK